LAEIRTGLVSPAYASTRALEKIDIICPVVPE
jgi:hypothetical protein